jgi:hypothetical protein
VTAALLLAALAWADPPPVTLNGVDISAVRDQRFKAVDVYIDEAGRVHVTSERYKVQVDAGADASVDGRPARVTPRAGDETAAAVAQTARAHPVDAPPRGSWWLASEDNGSTGHEVVVRVNGELAATVRSGQPQLIEDISHLLRRGMNRVTLEMTSTDPTGRTLFVYVGRGSNDGGTVALGHPEIQHGLGPTRQGKIVRDFDLRVD